MSVKMIEKIRPIYDRLVVKKLATEEKTSSGIIIPDGSQERSQTGEVIAVGNGRISPDGNLIPMQVKKGDIVYFSKYAGIETSGEYSILREDEILGVID